MKNLSKKNKLLVGALTLISTLSFEGQSAYAQVKIGDNPQTINGGSALEIEANAKGLLLPRVSLFKTDVWGLDGTPVVGMQVYNINGNIFATESHPIIQQGSGVYYWDGKGWVGTKAVPASEFAVVDFDWLKSSDDGNPSDPGDIAASIYHGGAASQQISVRTTSTNNVRSSLTAVVGHGSSNPIISNFFASDDPIYGRIVGIASPSADPISFRTTDATNLGTKERMRITNEGRVGIGTVTPQNGVLHVSGGEGLFVSDGTTLSNSLSGAVIRGGRMDIYSGTGSAALRLADDYSTNYNSTIGYEREGNTGNLSIRINNPGNNPNDPESQTSFPAITALGIGRVGINNINPKYTFDVLGDINADGQVRSFGTALTSDLRLKQDVMPVENALTVVSKLRPVSYKKKQSISSSNYDRSEIGFIAQEVRKILPQLVSEGKDVDKTLALDYNSLIPVLTKAIQELQEEIKVLSLNNSRLSGQVANLEQSAKTSPAPVAKLD